MRGAPGGDGQASCALQKGAFGNKGPVPRGQGKSRGEQARSAVCKPKGNAGSLGPILQFVMRRALPHDSLAAESWASARPTFRSRLA